MTVKFKYTKHLKDNAEEVSQRALLYASINKIQASRNKCSDIEDANASYLEGYEIDTEGMLLEDVHIYTSALQDYFFNQESVTCYLQSRGLDPSKIEFKSFKKENISNFNIIK